MPRQHKRQQARHHEQPEIEFALGIQPGGIVKIEPMRTHQHHRVNMKIL